MPPKIRLANKTQWALQDIVSDCKQMRRQWDKALATAERNRDPVMVVMLSRLIERVGAIESKAIRALHGEYDGGGEE